MAGRPKSMKNLFKPDTPVKKHNPTASGEAGFDNPRENIDPKVIQRWEPLSINFFIDGGGAEIDTGIKGCLRIPFPCTIQRSTLLVDQSGSIKIDIWKDSYGNYPPTDADSICGGNEPEISGATKNEDSTLTSWSKDLDAGDIIYFNVDSVATCTWCLIELKILRNG